MILRYAFCHFYVVYQLAWVAVSVFCAQLLLTLSHSDIVPEWTTQLPKYVVKSLIGARESEVRVVDADATGLAIWFGSKLPTLAIFPLLVVM